MDYERRDLLGVLGIGVGLAAAGCVSREESDAGTPPRPSDLTQRGQQSGKAPKVDDAVAEQQETVTPEEPATTSAETRLAETTDRIMDELSWFATEYDSAIDAYRDAGDSVTETVRNVGAAVPLTEQDARRLDGEIDRPRAAQGWPYDVWWSKGEKRWRRADIDWQAPSEDDPESPLLERESIDSLRETVRSFADTFEEQLGPHFSGAGKEREFGAEIVRVIERFNGLGDAAMVVAGLVRLFEHYETVTGGTYVQENLSQDPIRNRLSKYLASPSVEGVQSSPLFEVDYRGRLDHKAFSHSRSVNDALAEQLYQAEPTSSIDGTTSQSGQLRLQDVTTNLSVATNRADRCYCIVTDWQGQGSAGYTAEMPSETIFVQRYADADSALEAERRLFDRSSVQQIDGSEIQLSAAEAVGWTPILFRYGGEIWYAIYQQVNRHLIVAGVGRRPVEHRGDLSDGAQWVQILGMSWLSLVSESDE